MNPKVAQNPQRLIEFISCSESDRIIFKMGPFFKITEIGCPTIGKVNKIILEELKTFQEFRKHTLGNAPDTFRIAILSEDLLLGNAKWKMMNIVRDEENNKSFEDLLVFLGFSVSGMENK